MHWALDLKVPTGLDGAWAPGVHETEIFFVGVWWEALHFFWF